MVMPFAIAVLLLLVNVGMHWLGRSVVEAAAADGLTEAQAFGVSDAVGDSAANSTLNGFGLLRNKSVNVSRDTSTVRVTVVAEVQPFFFPSLGVITAEAEGPIERYYTPDERDG